MDEVLAQIEESTKNPYYIYKTKMIKKNLTKEQLLNNKKNDILK